MNWENKFYFNASDAFTVFGIIPNKGFYGELLRTPAADEYAKSWADENGTERDFSTRVFSAKTMELPFLLNGSDEYDLFDKYKAFGAFIYANENFILKGIEIDRQFTLKYRSMPSFDKLTKFRHNNNLYVGFTLSVTDYSPQVLKRANGTVITLTYPSDVDTDYSDIDFNDYTFEMVNYQVLMIGDPDVQGFINLNGNNLIDTYGIYFDQNTYKELMRMPEQKGEIPLKFNTRSLGIPFIMIADSEADFYEKWYMLVAFILDTGYFNLDVANLNRRFILCYSDMPAIEKLTVFKNNLNKVVVKFTLTLFDDSPTVEGGLNIFDGRFEVDENNDLIYKQNSIFDDRLSFELTEDKDLIVNIL